ncbi:MAG TPA: hypothetical protein VJ885_06505 [Thermoanaerobaculia bacterium]|nr:hypothetical protein [Thermoanaerobaculia bacterium]
MRLHSVLAVLVILAVLSPPGRAAAQEEREEWTAGLTPQGGGLFVQSPDGKTLFRLYGYAQPTVTYTHKDNGTSFKEADLHFDGRGNGSFLAGSGWRPTALAQLQIKF